MGSKSLLVLAAATALAIGLAVWLSTDRGATPQEETGALLPGLRESLNDVTELAVSSRGNKATLRRTESGWVVAERNDFPADTATLREQLIALADATVLERKTSNPEFYGELGVGDPEDEGKGGVLVAVSRSGESADVIVGDTNDRRGGSSYVRRATEDQALLVNGTFRLDPDPVTWLRKDILDVPATRVRRVAVTRDENLLLEAVKAEESATQFLVSNVPEERELTSPSAAGTVGGALAALRLDDVVPAGDVERPESATQTVYETFDGLRITSRAWEADEQHYVTFDASYDESLLADAEAPADDEDSAATEDEGDPESQMESGADVSDTADVAAEAEAIAERVEGWVYVIPSYKFTNLTKSVDDLLKPLEDEDDEDEEDSG